MAVSLEKFSKARLDLSHDGVPASENGLKTD
jgi:hypothetical protein